MKLLLALILSISSFAGLRKTQTENCTLYKVDNTITRETAGKNIISRKNLYGLYLKNMKINFDERNVTFDLQQAVVMGFDTMLTNVTIDESHPKFEHFTNLLQKDLYLFDEICIDRDLNIVDYKLNQ